MSFAQVRSGLLLCSLYLSGIAICAVPVLCVHCLSANAALPLLVNEREHSARIAVERNGVAEFRTPDGSRVDVLTDDYATEVEWSSKWAEAIGQSLYYGIATNRKPAIILLVKNPEKERRYYLRCLAVCAKYNIRLETRRVNGGR